MDSKPWKSKTLWFNLALAVVALVSPSAREAVAANPELALGVIGAIGIVLRIVTKGKVSLE